MVLAGRVQQKSQIGLAALLKALDHFPDASIIFTQPNCDLESRMLTRLIEKYVAGRKGETYFSKSMGQSGYISAMWHSDVVIGNSSSGILEVPALKKPSVNIGDRQRGRIRAASVIDCVESERAIVHAILRALSPAFQRKLRFTRSLYGSGDTAERIKNIIKKVRIDRQILAKKFYDISRPGYS